MAVGVIAMPDLWIRLTVATLATWRIAAYLYYDKGSKWVRDKAQVYAVDDSGMPITFWGRQLTCFWCMAGWVALPVSIIALSSIWYILIFPAVWGAVILLGAGGAREIWRSTQ